MLDAWRRTARPRRKFLKRQIELGRLSANDNDFYTFVHANYERVSYDFGR
jgi:hypothetical protein